MTDKKKKKHAGGRPTRYKKEFNEQASKLALLGATDKQLADFFGVRESTINNWKKRYPEFLESIKGSKLYADSEVVKSLYQRAIGYSHDEDKIFNNDGIALIVPTIKHYPPDATSMIFWLKNRQPELFRDKHEVTLQNITIGKPQELEDE